MKASYIKNSLELLIEAKQPTFLWGAPGIGKSQVVAQVATEKGLELRDIRAVLLDPVDLRGLPTVNGNRKVHWAVPEFLPTEGEGILFLDELNAAPQSVQAACYQLVLDRKLGEYVMPDGWTIIAAGNRETDRAVTNRMSSALANRFVHLNFDVNMEDWVTWAIEKDIATEVMSFVRFRPALLHSFDPKNTEKAFPTPRSWEFVSNIVKGNTPPEIEYELFSGVVGEGAAAEFLSFLKIWRELPNPDVVLMNPEGADIPDDPATLYALTGAISQRAGENNFDRVVRFADRIPEEFQVLLIRDSVNRSPDVQHTKSFIEWVSKNQDVLI